MKIEQFEDQQLSHYSYAILSQSKQEIVLIDTSRHIQPYLEYAKENDAKIIAVIETHPHADFVSGHLELHETTGAVIYCSKLSGVSYPHQTFDDGDELTLGHTILKAINTPGHSPDSICVLLRYQGEDKAIFTGDTLFIGDCGRPDLREKAGSITAQRNELAAQMFHSLRNKMMFLGDKVVVYPAHGAGSLCGKALSKANKSSIGEEKLHNWALQELTEAEFVSQLNAEQPFVPAYFPFDVELNRNGAKPVEQALAEIPVGIPARDFTTLDEHVLIIDTRPSEKFAGGHLPGAVNLMAEGKFETWLGTIVLPGEEFYLVAGDATSLGKLLLGCCKIGYESFIKAAFVMEEGPVKSNITNVSHFKSNPALYTIVDVRNLTELKNSPGFKNAIHIPLPELRQRFHEIPIQKPIMVHCAGGYRSAAASSLLQKYLSPAVLVYDLSTAVTAILEA
jgi:hydroxyacylglutathione hydrolase